MSKASVLVKGMEMPKSCFGCHLFNLDDQDLWCIANHYAGCCRVLSKYIDENKFVIERHPDCPLVEIPPHGRLIDADVLKQSAHLDGRVKTCIDTWIDSQEAVIEAERDENEY